VTRKRPINLEVVRDVRRNLERIAREHPEAFAPERLAQFNKDSMKTRVISLRLNEETAGLVEQARRSVVAANPALQISTPDAIRMLIREALIARDLLKTGG
jgi:hypothetical protein